MKIKIYRILNYFFKVHQKAKAGIIFVFTKSILIGFYDPKYKLSFDFLKLPQR